MVEVIKNKEDYLKQKEIKRQLEYDKAVDDLVSYCNDIIGGFWDAGFKEGTLPLLHIDDLEVEYRRNYYRELHNAVEERFLAAGFNMVNNGQTLSVKL